MKYNKRLKGKILVSSLIVSSALVSSVSISNANELLESNSSLSESNLSVETVKKEDLQSFFEENNVPKDKQKVLIDKLEKGIPWDANNPSKARNVSKDMDYIDIESGTTEKYFRFNDGSFIKVAFEQDDSINSRKIQTDSFGTLYSNHKVSKTVGNISASYALTVRGFGLANDPTLKIVKEQESSRQAAMVDASWRTSININAGWEGNGVSIPSGGTAHLYTALKNKRIYVSSRIPNI